MPDLRLEIEGEGFYLEVLTEEGALFVSHDLNDNEYNIGDHVQYPMIVQDMVVQEIQNEGLALDF